MSREIRLSNGVSRMAVSLTMRLVSQVVTTLIVLSLRELRRVLTMLTRKTLLCLLLSQEQLVPSKWTKLITRTELSSKKRRKRGAETDAQSSETLNLAINKRK